MKNRNILIGFIILTTPYIIYICHFYESDLSYKTSDWGNFGSYINGIIAPIIAFLGIIITYTLSQNNKKTNLTLLKRKEMEQRPLLYVSYDDYENYIEIKISNKGIGPAVIQEYIVKNTRTGVKYDSFYNILKEINLQSFTYYTGDMSKLIMSPNEEKYLFIQDRRKENESEEDLVIELIRNKICDLKIIIKYQGIYEKGENYTFERSLKWFGRNLGKE